MTFDLRDYADSIDSALAEGRPTAIATVGDSGPDIGFKGSLLVLDGDRLAYWERTLGQHLENVRAHPEVAVLYFHPERGQYVRFYGRASVHEHGAVRDAVLAKVVPAELERDPERKGVAVVIDVHTVSEPFGRGTLTREPVAA